MCRLTFSPLKFLITLKDKLDGYLPSNYSEAEAAKRSKVRSKSWAVGTESVAFMKQLPFSFPFSEKNICVYFSDFVHQMT